MSTPTQPAPAEGLAYCYRHPLRESGVRCNRCGRPICPDCMRPVANGYRCPDDVSLTSHGAARLAGLARPGAPRPVSSGPPVVTWALLAGNVLVYLSAVMAASWRFDHPAAGRRSSLFHSWQLQPAVVSRGGVEFQRLLTSAFLHVNLLHIALNMIALLIVGPQVERVLGTWRYLVVYLAGALGGSVAVYLFAVNHYQPVAGASGAVYGVFAAALLLVRRTRADLRMLVAVIVLNFVCSIAITGISRIGHVGGLVVGALATAAMLARPPEGRRAFPWQLVGLAAVAALLVVAVAIRTATFPIPI